MLKCFVWPVVGCLVCGLLSITAIAQEVLPDGTNAAKAAISKFKVPDGMKVELFAAEPQLASPVAIGLDEKNRVFVAEEYRFNRGTEENRTRPFLLDDDLQIRTLEDRLNVFKKYADKFDGGMNWFSKVSDQVRLLEDSDGDGKADKSTIFAGKFNEPLDGLAAGVMARNGSVYLTCIPHLWLLKDKDGDGIAEERKPLLTGFGVNCGFLGHDLHGLAWGPDGKLYFSVGDRGFHVTSQEGRTFSLPRRGAVFRCDADGKNFEVVHIGLRNPQEIAFDEFGNLFAADNNCDKGDHSRLVYVVDGGDSGWNMAYQTIAAPYLTGPWHAEKLWHVEAPDQPAWVLPPVGKLGAGPSGFAYYPGTGLDDRYQHHFFMCNYTGNGGVESFSIKPKGARFEMTDEHNFFKPIMATDMEFGYDGKVYVADFVNLDWSGKALGGRVYTLSHTEKLGTEAVKQTREIFAAGIEKLPPTRLLELFAHPDMRVRLRAQYAYADAVLAASDALLRTQLIADLKSITARTSAQPAEVSAARAIRHAMWALGRVARREPQAALPELRRLISAADPEVRAQAIKLVSDARNGDAAAALTEALKDSSARVRFFAALGLAKIGGPACIPSVVEMLKANADADPYLRHAGVMALQNCATQDDLIRLSNATEPALRLAALLTLRRHADPSLLNFTVAGTDQKSPKALPLDWVAAQLARFLNDADPRLVTEAARAINDVPVDAAMPVLAQLIDRLKVAAAGGPTAVPEALVRRVINANFRAGGIDHARAIASLITLPQLAANMRAEALNCLADWEQPSQRDRVTGFWRPLTPRDSQITKTVLTENVAALLSRTEGDLQANVLKLINRSAIPVDDQQIAGWARDNALPIGTRAESLRLLASRKAKPVDELVAMFLKSDQPRLRSVARQVLAMRDAAAALASVREGFGANTLTTAEAQDAVRLLVELKQPEADKLLQDGFSNSLLADTSQSAWSRFGGGLNLELIEAAHARATEPFQKLTNEWRAKTVQGATTNPLQPYQPALVGGDVERGLSIFRGHPQAQCLRCHKIKGEGGDAGPDLSGVALRGDRTFLLESLIDPHAKIAKGFGTVSFVMADGQVLSGVIESETKDEVVIVTATRDVKRLKAAGIEERTPPKSAMPGVKDTLPLRDVRDLVEFLTTLKTAPNP